MDKRNAKVLWISLALSTGVGVILTLISAAGSISKLGILALVLLGGVSCSSAVVGMGWIKRPRAIGGVAKTIGVFAFIWIVMILLGRNAWPSDQRRHLSGNQIEGLAKARDNFPKSCGMLVYVPIESTEAQEYGKEIQGALQKHGSKANLAYAGAMQPPTGIVIGVHSSLEPCGFAGEMLSVEMTHDLHIPARLQENFLPYADQTTVVIFVGTKPGYE